jgi:Xaa-Pro aminopeptidase
MCEIAYFLLKERGVSEVLVPASFPVLYADTLRKKGLMVHSRQEPFFEERLIKSNDEVRAISSTQRAVERAVREASLVLRKSKIQGKFLIYQKKRLTSEYLKRVINVSLMESGCVPTRTIVACGPQSVDPHHEGAGMLCAHQPIVIDVFPFSDQNRYFADMTRTFVHGKASDKLKRMYRAVSGAQKIAFGKIRHGVSGKSVHQAILAHFEKSGFKSGEIDGRMQGFFHSTGHGVGLEIHEPPRISNSDEILKTGQVVTVEPGLYYQDSGGIRIEDMVLVTKTGCLNLTKFPKALEL